MVDAPASGAGVRKDVEVRVLSWAPALSENTPNISILVDSGLAWPPAQSPIFQSVDCLVWWGGLRGLAPFGRPLRQIEGLGAEPCADAHGARLRSSENRPAREAVGSCPSIVPPSRCATPCPRLRDGAPLSSPGRLPRHGRLSQGLRGSRDGEAPPRHRHREADPGPARPLHPRPLSTTAREPRMPTTMRSTGAPSSFRRHGAKRGAVGEGRHGERRGLPPAGSPVAGQGSERQAAVSVEAL